MCPEAWYIFIRTIQLCAVLLLCAFMLLVEWNGSMNENYELYVLANGLNEITQAILLIELLKLLRQVPLPCFDSLLLVEQLLLVPIV